VPSSVHTSVYVTPTPLPKTRWPHQKVVGYYSGDMAQFMEPDSVPWKLLTHVSYAFAFINPDFTINVSAVASKEVMGSVFEEAAKHKVAGVLSVGGWGPGSSEFSAMVSKVDNRFAFVQSVYDLVTAYPSISGLDIDWEYPGRVSAPGVPYNAKKDIPGFLNLLAELRAVFGSHFTLSAALAGVTPFSSDVRKIAELLDWAVVMEFDFATGELNQTTSNAPLLGSLSGESGVKAWYEAGLPMEKMIYGIPGYGRAFNLTDVLSLPPPNCS
jgi:chitinase